MREADLGSALILPFVNSMALNKFLYIFLSLNSLTYKMGAIKVPISLCCLIISLNMLMFYLLVDFFLLEYKLHETRNVVLFTAVLQA